MLEIDGGHLVIDDVVKVARDFHEVRLNNQGAHNIDLAHHNLMQLYQADTAIYGINTGFGIFADRRIKQEEAALLSRNLIISHAVSTGDALPEDVVRAAALIRANTLTKGYSGVRKELVQTILDVINSGIYPIIPSQGSMGSSGDLSPLSHLALIFTRDEQDLDEESGFAFYNNELVSGKDAMRKAGLERIVLGPKEGLALNNGATFSVAIAALAIHDAEQLLRLSDIAIAFTMEALLGKTNAYDARIHAARGHAGQIETAARVLQHLSGSTFVNSDPHIQDAYSLRCAPQVTGCARDTLAYVRTIVENEINAATDNPLILSDTEAVSGGNFHGEPIGMVMDFLSIAMAEVGAISERRSYRLTDGKMNLGLPPMLVDTHEAAGLNSGLMMPQYTAASLALENKTLASPDTVHSLPTSGGQEDHNANSMTAARHTAQLLANVTHILTLEIHAAIRAIELRKRQYPELVLGSTTGLAYDMIRSKIPYQAGDAWWQPEIEKLKLLLVSDEFDKLIS